MNQTSYATRLLWLYRRQAVALATFVTVVSLFVVLGLTARGREVMERESRAASIQQGIAAQILRFHVIANSDSEEDQALKLQVRDAVLEEWKRWMTEGATLEETKEQVENHLADLKNAAEKRIAEAGYTYPVSAELTTSYFPEKTYGDCTFPAGEYEALRICIGDAAGKNWWCVLFPNLCFVDSIHAILPQEQKELLENVLTEEEYDSLFDWKKSDISFKTLFIDL
jgi:stage II sporulation protein R